MPVAVALGSARGHRRSPSNRAVPEDGEHPVEGEALPQFDSEEVRQADRMAEQCAFGGPALLSYCCHVGEDATPSVASRPIASTHSWAKSPPVGGQEFNAAQHISAFG